MAAYQVLLLNTAVPQIQAAQSGDTYVVPRDIAFSAALTLSAGTANGVPYLNGSKVLTTGSALTFDGTNLGLGVTPSAWGSTYRALQVGLTASLVGLTNDTRTHLSTNASFDGTDWRYIATSPASRYAQIDNQHQWFTAPSGTAGNAISFTQAMTLDASGNLKVGTTGGSAKLVVYQTTDDTTGGVQIYATDGTGAVISRVTDGGLTFRNGGSERARITSGGDLLVGGLTSYGRLTVQTDGTNGSIGFVRNTDNSFAAALDFIKSRGSGGSPTAVQNNDDLVALRVAPYQGSAYTYLTSYLIQVDGTFTSGQNPPTRIAWYTNAANGSSTERVRITSGGYFKASNNGAYIGSASAYHELRQTTDEQVVYITNTSSSLTGTVRGIRMQYTAASPNNTDNYFLYCDDNTALRAGFRSNGGLANYQSNDSDLSDIRTKTDITPLASYWNKIAALEIVTYKYKDQTHDDLNIGVIAQQVEQVAPEFVDVDGFGETPEDGVPLKTIYNKDLTFAAIKALQEAMARIETLEAEVAALKGN